MGEKTTIEIDNIRDLKQHALDTNKTLKQLINEAINEKIKRERNHSHNDNPSSQVDIRSENQSQSQYQSQSLSQPQPVKNTNYSSSNFNESNIVDLKKILSNAGLLTIVEKECSRHKILLKDISPSTITPQLINDIHTAIKLVFDDETADQIIERIESLIK